MKWCLPFKLDNNTLHELKEICDNIKVERSPEVLEEQEDCTDNIVVDSKIWIIRNHDEDYDLSKIRKKLHEVTGMNLDYNQGFFCVWQYDETFKSCPIHIDSGGKHTGSLCVATTGSFQIILNDKETHEELDRITVEANDIITLNNTKYWHYVEGQGDLIVFGGDIDLDVNTYFK